jgi:hypothetical protein
MKRETKEETFLRMAENFMREYEQTSWWRFSKRVDLKRSWQSAIECAIRYS